MFWTKHQPRCFWRCLKKTKTSCSRCILTMFFKRLAKYRKVAELNLKIWIVSFRCVKAVQSYIFDRITRLLSYICMEFLKPKTSCKTSCFLLNNAMFWRCFWKTLTSMFLTMFFKTQNIGQTMHLTMFNVNRVDIWRDQCDQRSCKIIVSRVNFQKTSRTASQFTQSKGHTYCSHHSYIFDARNLCAREYLKQFFTQNVKLLV